MYYPKPEDIRLFEEQLNKKEDEKEDEKDIDKMYKYKTISDKSENNTKKNQRNIEILSMSKNIDLIFDKETSIILYITYTKKPELYKYHNNDNDNDNDNNNDNNIINVPIPDEIKFLNRKDIISKSTTLVGSIISVKSIKLSKCIEEPTAISFILFEKIDKSENFDIKIIPNLEFNDICIKESNFIDVIFSNINTFWVIIKDDNNKQHIIYYYKSFKNIVNILNYNYDSIPIIDYTFICSLWSYYDITPSVIYLIVHDKNFNIIILQYTIYNIDKPIPDITQIPKIVLYYKDKRLFHCGKYLSYCVNYNISMFSILLEIDNNVKTFYTGILLFKKINSQLKLEISYSHYFPKKNITMEESQFIIYSIMKRTEREIKIQNFEEHKQKINIKCIKEAKSEKDEKEETKETSEKNREKYCELIAEALIKEEEIDKLKKKKLQEKINCNTKNKFEKERLEKERIKKERLEKERLEKERVEKERLEKERLEKELIKKERLEKERVEKERLEKERLEKERLEKERLEKERLEKERLEKERLEKERLEKERLEKERLEKERLEKERLEKERLEKERLEKEQLEKERLQNERLEKEQIDKKKIEKETILEEKFLLRQNKLLEDTLSKKKAIEEIISNYHISNSIERRNTEYSIFYCFIYHLSMIDLELANEILYFKYESNYMNLIYTNRITIMYALDMLVINNINILSIKKKIDKKKVNGYTMSALYGSVLPVIYSLILNELGYNYTPFNKHSEPLKMIDIDTMVIKILDDFIETDRQTEYIKAKTFIIDYFTHEKPITRTQIQTSSLHNLLCNCWDLNYTSAILIYEQEKEPYIIRHPDFTEFIFGNQLIQILLGKTEKSLFNYHITIRRLQKAKEKWY